MLGLFKQTFYFLLYLSPKKYVLKYTFFILWYIFVENSIYTVADIQIVFVFFSFLLSVSFHVIERIHANLLEISSIKTDIFEGERSMFFFGNANHLHKHLNNNLDFAIHVKWLFFWIPQSFFVNEMSKKFCVS